MKLANLHDVPLEVLQRGVNIVERYAQALLVFDENWNLVEKKIKKAKVELPVIAIVGPSKIGSIVHIEVGFRRFLPYRKANKSTARDIFIPARVKIVPNLIIDWAKVLPLLSQVMQELAKDIIKNWKSWDNYLGFPYYFARSFRTRADYVKKLWTPPKDGITFHISEYDEYLLEVFSLAEIYTNRRFQEKMKGLMGVVHVIQKHFDLYNDIYKKRRLETIRTVINDSTLPQLLKDPRKFKALLSFSYRTLSNELFISKPQEFINFLRKLGYLSKELWQEYLNYCVDIETHRQVYKQKSRFIEKLTDNLQISLSGIKKRKIKVRVNNRFIKQDSYYYSFKVYYDEGDKKPIYLSQKDLDVPF